MILALQGLSQYTTNRYLPSCLPSELISTRYLSKVFLPCYNFRLNPIFNNE